MKFKLGLSLVFVIICAAANFAQTDLQIKKKTSRQMPGRAEIPTLGMSPEMANQLKKINETTTIVYLKGSQTRTDVVRNMPKMTGGFEPQTFTTIVQCKEQRVTVFDTKTKKYTQSSINGQTPMGAKSGGHVTVTGSVTDTGERAKLFGFESRRLQQIYVFTPGANACLNQKMQIEIDGWYADWPEFSCPMRQALPENADGIDCLDDFDYQIKGAVTGVALKEIKKITFGGQIITSNEEATEVSKISLPTTFFEPPTSYTAANPQSKSSETAAKTASQTPTVSSVSNSFGSLPLPSAGVEKPLVGEKKAGMIRVGIAKPKVTTPESKKDPNAGDDILNAVNQSLQESLKTENVEALQLETEFPENEAKEKGCDYIFYANVTQKRGGGMFKSIVMMGAITAASVLVPGVGGIIASTAGSVMMGQTMGKAARAKDEFTLDYKVVGLDKTVLSQAVTKSKTEKEGEDVLTPQIQQASKTVLGEIAKKQSK